MVDILNFSSEDVFNRLIELNFPVEIATFFKNEMKYGLYNYINAEKISIIESGNVYLITSLIKLLGSLLGKNLDVKLPYNSKDPFYIMEQLRPFNGLIPQESQIIDLKPMTSTESKTSQRPLQPITNLTSRSNSNSQTSVNSVEKCCFHSPVLLEPSNTKVFLLNKVIYLPKFNPIVEESLNTADECLSVIPTMCNELSAYLRKIDCQINSSSDYRTLADAILNKYEVLYGIIMRRINMDFPGNETSAKPKPHTFITKHLTNAVKRTKRESKRSPRTNHENRENGKGCF